LWLKVAKRLISSFVYDGDNHRVKGTAGGVTTAYIGNYYEVAGSTVKKYYYAGSQRVAMKAGTTLYWLLGDHLGSTAVTVSGTTETGEVRYTAWGADRLTSGSTPTSFKYTGQRQESGIGLYYYGARWYDPALGRFTQPDTLVPNPGDAKAFDRYAYVLNNPLRYQDPTGHCTTLANGDADWEGDGACWGLAYSIYGLGSGTEQEQFTNDWRVSPDAWLRDIASAGYATTQYLQPFHDKYRGSFDGRTGLTQGTPNEGPPPPDVFNELIKVYGSALLSCAQAIQGACGVSYGGTAIIPGAVGKASLDLYADASGTLALFGTLGGGISVMLFPQPIAGTDFSYSAFPRATVHDLEGFSALLGGTASFGKGVSADLAVVVSESMPWGVSGSSVNGVFNAEAHFVLTYSWLLHEHETR
jgi:RHS repeat-associated protein